MLGSSLIGGRSSSSSGNRVFVYEVTGLKQNDSNDLNSYPVRNSDSIFIRVPYGRMNEEMLRIGKMGGTIVNIQSLADWQQQRERETDGNSED